MKNKILFPFAISTLLMALSGCGGESANVIKEPGDEATENGACTPVKLTVWNGAGISA